MAKKKTVRRVPPSVSPRMFGDGKPSQAAQAAAGKAAAPSRPATGPAVVRGAANLAQEYSYVVGDLKRLGIIAGALFGGLIVLGIVIR